MLTLKLRNSLTNHLKIVECREVDVVHGDKQNAILYARDADKEQTFEVSSASEFDTAYIENAQGRTTQIVRPGGNGR